MGIDGVLKPVRVALMPVDLLIGVNDFTPTSSGERSMSTDVNYNLVVMTRQQKHQQTTKGLASFYNA